MPSITRLAVRFVCLAAFLAAAAALSSAPAAATEIDHAREYGICMKLARTRPDDGFERALAWKSMGGGTPADHCAAVALIGLKQYAEAAKRLDALAKESLTEPKIKSGLYEQAGQAWLLDSKYDKAIDAFSAAIALEPVNADLYADRAEAWAGKGDYKAAEGELTAALNLAPARADIYALRASARRFLKNTEDAMSDANTALELAPDNPDALLERGILRRMAGDDAGARQDWLHILRKRPDSAAAADARHNIEMMDVKPENGPAAPAPSAPPTR